MDPLSFINKKNIEIKYTDDVEYVAKTELNNKCYIIYISMHFFKSVEKSKLRILIDGLKFHEVAHIKYDSFSCMKELQSHGEGWIFNVLEDDRVEYQLSLKYPLIAKYFSLVSNLIQNDIFVKVKSVSVKTNEEKGIEKDIQMKLDCLYDFVRNGMLNTREEKFIDFVRPLMLSAKRNNVKNCVNVSKMIYNYIIYEAKNNDKDIIMNNKAQKDINNEIDRKNNEIKEIEIEENKEQNNIKTSGEVTSKKAFQTLIVEKDAEIIKNLVNVFKNITTSHNFYPTLEGEINFKKIQEAYINSFIGEEGYNYLSYKLIETCFDAIIVRDVSGSTWGVREDYARAAINLVAAITSFKNNNVGCVDFDCNTKILKTFENRFNYNIMPYSGGSTDLAGALLEVSKNFEWKNKKKFIIIICDGYPNNTDLVIKQLETNLFYKNVEVISVSLMTDKKLLDTSIIVNNLKELPESILKVLGSVKR